VPGTLTVSPPAGQAARTPPPLVARRAGVTPWAATIFVASALVFLVQPMAARMLLPLLGGSPAVWTTAMLFFQTLLLAGYAYAHLSTRMLGVDRQRRLHILVLLAPLAFLPLALPAGWTPPTQGDPSLWVLLALGITVGVPYFVVATAGPLLQRWFAGTDHPAARDPYFLYAAGNAGSVVGLLAYPLVLEPRLGLEAQGRLWAAGYGVFALGCLACALLVGRGAGAPSSVPAALVATRPARAAPRVADRARWVVLAFVPSSLMLGATTFLTTDLAPVPLLWIVPLALYLGSFVVVFARGGERAVPWAGGLLVAGVLAIALSTLELVALPLVASAGLHLGTLAAGAVAVHGRLAAMRPDPRWLTGFYLWVSVGGALGGVFNGLLAPALFDDLLEYPLVLVAALMVRPVAARGVRAWATGAIALLAAGLLVWSHLAPGPALHRERTFFGVHSVYADPYGRHVLSHGTTVHGYQSTDPQLTATPLAYYHPESTIAQVLGTLRLEGRARDVGVVGLGTGAIAGLAGQGQAVTFYEIDPEVARIARDPALFTYLANSAAAVDVRLGDGRLALAQAPPGTHDVIAVDAFTSDAIPVHLITREAVEAYLDALTGDGVLAFHVTNRHLELEPVLGRIAADLGLVAIAREDPPSVDDDRRGLYASHWVLLARDAADLPGDLTDPRWHTVRPDPDAPRWTDTHSSLLDVLDWR
jgi:SAM-dependent methyltransferase